MHFLRLVGFFALLATVLSPIGCHSGKFSPTDGGVLVKPVDEKSADDPSNYPVDPAPCDCHPSTPSLGTCCIQSRVIWYEGWIDRDMPGKAKRYWRASVPTSEGAIITLIAGAISADGEPNDDARGVAPPVSVGFTPGLNLEHCFGGPSASGCKPEVSTLHGGFLYAQVDSAVKIRSRFWAPWPYIVRTKAIPAGAYSTKFVLLAVPNAGGTGTLREVVYRPNQDMPDCSNAADTDAKPGTVVVAQPNDGSTVFSMTTVSYVEANSTAPQTLGGADAQFLRDVCAFAQLVKALPMPTVQAKPAPCTR